MDYKSPGGARVTGASSQPAEYHCGNCYIISEKLTSEIEGYLKEKFPDCIALRIPRVIRSHPYNPSAQAALREEGAMQERERVLDSLKEEILLCKYNISYPEIGDNCAEHLLHTIESLRQSQSQSTGGGKDS